MDALKSCVACGSDKLAVRHYGPLSSRALPKAFSEAKCETCGHTGFFSDHADRKGQTYIVIDRTPPGY